MADQLGFQLLDELKSRKMAGRYFTFKEIKQLKKLMTWKI